MGCRFTMLAIRSTFTRKWFACLDSIRQLAIGAAPDDNSQRFIAPAGAGFRGLSKPAISAGAFVCANTCGAPLLMSVIKS